MTMKLEKTADHSKFVTNDEQRPIKEKHVKKLASAMQSMGFLPSKPIQCYRKNGKLVMVDGHHRFAAAKSLGIPVFYVVEDEQCQESMAAENSLVSKWGGEDFVRLFAMRGFKDYMELMAYKQKGIPINMAASMLIDNAAGSNNAQRCIHDGTFKIKTRNQINAVLSFLEEFGEINPAIKSRSFIAAISNIVLCEDVSLETMRIRIRENPTMISKASTQQAMLAQLETVYNHRSRNPIPLKFLVEKAATARAANQMGPKK